MKFVLTIQFKLTTILKLMTRTNANVYFSKQENLLIGLYIYSFIFQYEDYKFHTQLQTLDKILNSWDVQVCFNIFERTLNVLISDQMQMHTVCLDLLHS